MNNQIQTQAAKVWQLVKDPDTGATYTKTVSTTWALLKETGYLLWLVVCLTLVFGDWIWRTGYRTGWSTREWINNFEKPNTDRVAQDAGQGLLEASKSAVTSAIATAKNQLGIEAKPEPLLTSTPPATPAPKATPAPTPTPTPTPTPAPPLKPSTPPSPNTEELDSE
ncbi:hypothetical protein [Stenomitos frigidus]|uniref:hypothetical protein n=1 Tax=Stenomitos frigidus TaxID=1886765 RepID=UPI0015E7E20A|nr:hypothetical protein [Stenomitos frigidus]